jgi:hypothetical protein
MIVSGIIFVFVIFYFFYLNIFFYYHSNVLYKGKLFYFMGKNPIFNTKIGLTGEYTHGDTGLFHQ